jgi:hypothetical protein
MTRTGAALGDVGARMGVGPRRGCAPGSCAGVREGRTRGARRTRGPRRGGRAPRAEGLVHGDGGARMGVGPCRGYAPGSRTGAREGRARRGLAGQGGPAMGEGLTGRRDSPDVGLHRGQGQPEIGRTGAGEGAAGMGYAGGSTEQGAAPGPEEGASEACHCMSEGAPSGEGTRRGRGRRGRSLARGSTDGCNRSSRIHTRTGRKWGRGGRGRGWLLSS